MERASAHRESLRSVWYPTLSVFCFSRQYDPTVCQMVFFVIIFSNHLLYAEEEIAAIDSDVLRMMYGLWEDSGFVKDPNRTERAAWIVCDSANT